MAPDIPFQSEFARCKPTTTSSTTAATPGTSSSIEIRELLTDFTLQESANYFAARGYETA
jgi:hypothetical protein